MYAIEVENLTKRFGNFVAVDNVEIKVKQGEIFGFLGANGAGKTTTIKMLIGLLPPTIGKIVVGGVDVVKYPQKVKEKIGYMSQKFSLYNDLTVEENLNFFGRIYGLSGKRLEALKSELFEKFGISGYEKHLTKEIPTGIKQKLALGISLLHKPKIVFLDEPTSGTDPISRRNFWEIIQELAKEGIAVFVTTHYLEEAEYCNTISLIHQGKIVANGSPTELKRIFEDYPLFEVDFGMPEVNFDFASQKFDFGEFAIFGSKLHFSSKIKQLGESELRERLRKFYSASEISVRKITPSLEDVFINFIQSKYA